MKRIDHEDRLMGMAYALEQIRKNGVEAFEDELRMRKRDGVTLLVPCKEVEKYKNAVVDRATKVLTVFAVNTLFDEFDFTEEQCRQFMKRYDLKAHSLANEDITWEEQTSILEQEMDIHINFKE